MSARSRRHTVRRITLAAVKDFLLFGIGAGMLIKQGFFTPSQDANWAVMLVGAAVANVPAAQYLWALRSGSIEASISSPVSAVSSSPDSSP
jgi:hypothetical protein